MAQVYHISRNVGIGMIVSATMALAIIIALSIAYDKERAKGKPVDEGTVSTVTPPTTPASQKDQWDHYRLPDSLVPVSYNVTLWPRLKPNADGLFIFTGHTMMVFRCVKETDLIIIHCSKLNLASFLGHHAMLFSQGHAIVPSIIKSWLVVKTEYLVVQLDRRLAVGTSYVLYTEFSGELADDLEGFYRSEYMEDGVKKVIATSQMEATFARKTFPCFDEPAMKAVFFVTIIHDKATVALSNGREIDTTDSVINGVHVSVTTFEPTERMSTYLLAFIVSDFLHIQSTQNKNLLVRIWARKKAIDDGQAEYALKVTGKILQFYERYYNATYPLSKLDQIALPDFSNGAMENWGLLTFRETALLYDRNKSSTGNKERVTTVISHELAHMWFGNLVTMRWWNDLWLKEGLATYVESLGADYAEPAWNIKEHIVVRYKREAFAMDALASSHPLSRHEEEVNDPAQISEMYNTISYTKGAMVLRMLSEFLTEPVFAKGLSCYLKAFAFSNTVYTDLWDHLQQAVDDSPDAHVPDKVHNIMNSWILQMGFPVVTIDTRTGRVTQEHFLLDPDSAVDRPSDFNYTWFVPIKWMLTGVEQTQYWLLKKTDVNSEMRVSGEDWLLANTNSSGYFRVNYDLDNWDRLLSLLHSRHEALSVTDRAQIIDDAFNLARAKIIDTTLALRTTKYLSKERDFIPWESALRNFDYYILMFERTEVYESLQAYLRKQIEPLFKHLTATTANWTEVPTAPDDQFNQVNTIGIACSMGVKGCKGLIKAWYRSFMENPDHSPVHPSMISTVYCSAIALGGVEEWDFAWKMFRNATLASFASSLRSAMACTKVPWLLNRYLEYTLDPTKIRKQDAASTIRYIAGNVVGMPLAWNFVRERWDYISQNYLKGVSSFSHLINGISQRFSSEFELLELKRFKEENLHLGFGSTTGVMDRIIEKTAANVKWVKENKARVLLWFSKEST